MVFPSGRNPRLRRIKLPRKSQRQTAPYPLAVPSLPKAGKYSPKIVIVGAGIAGLSGALRLREAGYQATVYEAADRVGGRIRSIRDRIAPGIVTEAGAEFIDPDHTEVLALADRYSLPLLSLGQSSENELGDAFFFEGRHRSAREMEKVLWPLAERVARDQSGLQYTNHRSHNALAKHLDQIPLDAYLRSAGAEGWLHRLLDVAFLTEYGAPLADQSALNMLGAIGMDPAAMLETFGGISSGFKVRGGNDQIPKAMAEELGEESLQLGHVLRAVRSHGHGYVATFDTDGGTQDVAADFLLLTLPFTVLRRVELDIALPLALAKSIKTMAYGTNAKQVFGFDRRTWREQGQSGYFFTDLPAQSGWDSSQLQPGTAGAITIYLGGEKGARLPENTPPELSARWRANLDRIFPGSREASNGVEFGVNWTTNPYSLGSYSALGPGQYTNFGRLCGPVGNLFFAGEHVSQAFGGYMNGAAETGRTSAEQILSRIS